MTEKLSIVDESKSWYAKGLPFKCTGCGKCCTGGPGAVWISPEEVSSLATYFNITEDEFLQKYTCLISGKRSLKENKKNYDCVFLKNNQCSVYENRPTQCRTYPFWPQHLKSEKAWKEASQWCEGMDPNAPLVSYAQIEEQLTIHLKSE